MKKIVNFVVSLCVRYSEGVMRSQPLISVTPRISSPQTYFAIHLVCSHPTLSNACQSLLALLTSILQACWASVFLNSLPNIVSLNSLDENADAWM